MKWVKMEEEKIGGEKKLEKEKKKNKRSE